MTDKQFRFILLFAAAYLGGNVIAWLAFGVYCWFTGRL